jgi:hypothetical protein
VQEEGRGSPLLPERLTGRETRPVMTRPLVLRDWLLASVCAGLVSGITLAAFAAFADMRAGLPAAATYTFLASAVGGDALGASPSAVPVGVLVLFAGTILWALGYTYASRYQTQLLNRPLISGACFGVIVWFVMQAVLVGAGHFTAPTIYTFDRDMVAFIIFFGIPLTLVASRLYRPAP